MADPCHVIVYFTRQHLGSRCGARYFLSRSFTQIGGDGRADRSTAADCCDQLSVCTFLLGSRARIGGPVGTAAGEERTACMPSAAFTRRWLQHRLRSSQARTRRRPLLLRRPDWPCLAPHLLDAVQNLPARWPAARQSLPLPLPPRRRRQPRCPSRARCRRPRLGWPRTAAPQTVQKQEAPCRGRPVCSHRGGTSQAL